MTVRNCRWQIGVLDELSGPGGGLTVIGMEESPSMAGPLVSVIIPTYNRRALLAEALESALHQTHINLEIIVIDDGSTDDTSDYVRGLDDDRIVYLPIEHQGHPGATRNAGLERASGEFIAFLDSDDTWLPSKIETQLAALDVHPELDFVATDFFELPPRRSKTALGLTEPKRIIFEELLHACPIFNSSVLIRRKAVAAVGLQDETLQTCQDYEYWLRVLRRRDGCGMILPEPLAVYRRHGNNISSQDVVQCDRLSTIVARHRDYDENLIESVLGELQDRRAFRQALVDLEDGRTSLARALLRGEVRVTDRLRLIKQRMLKLTRGAPPA
jgi:hypothetical protein